MVVGKVVEEGVGEAVVEAEVEAEVQVEGVRGVEVTGDAPWRTSERRASLRPKPSGLPERLRGELVSSLSPKARGDGAAGVRTAGERRRRTISPFLSLLSLSLPLPLPLLLPLLGKL